MNKVALENLMTELSIPEGKQAILTSESASNVMDAPDVRSLVLKAAPFMGQVFDTWPSTSMQYFTLTSVGIALGHANIKRIIGKEFADLAIWIN